MRLCFLALLLSLTAFTAEAQPMPPSDVLMRDYIGLTKALRASGVDPVFVNWRFVENMCLPLKTERNQIPYNRCRYEKAVDTSDYPADAATCDQRARLAYTEAQQVVVQGNRNNVTIINAGTSLNNVRSNTFGDCMRERGWINPSNAGRGRMWNYEGALQ